MPRRQKTDYLSTQLRRARLATEIARTDALRHRSENDGPNDPLGQEFEEMRRMQSALSEKLKLRQSVLRDVYLWLQLEAGDDDLQSAIMERIAHWQAQRRSIAPDILNALSIAGMPMNPDGVMTGDGVPPDLTNAM